MHEEHAYQTAMSCGKVREVQGTAVLSYPHLATPSLSLSFSLTSVTTTYAIDGPNMIERRCAATATPENLVFTQLKIAETLGELEVEIEKIWFLICPDATALRHTSVTKIDVFVNSWASGFSDVAETDADVAERDESDHIEK